MKDHINSMLTKLGSAAFALAIALVGVELMLNVSMVRQVLNLPKQDYWEQRYTGFHRMDPELIYSLRPHYTGQWEEPAFKVPVTINSLGLRNQELKQKADSDERIIVLGDSMVFGWGAGDEETFPKRLEFLLNETGTRAEVINAGVLGYGTDQSYAFYMKRLAQLRPDLLIFCLFENDLYDNLKMPLYAIENNILVPLAVDNHPLYLLGSLHDMLPEFMRKMKIYRAFAYTLTRKLPYDRLPGRDMEALMEWSRNKVNLQMARLQEEARRYDFRLLIVGLPYKIGKFTDADFYSFLELDKERSDILDLSRIPVWSEQQQSLFMTGVDPHTNPSGYQLIAEQIAEYIHNDAASYHPGQ